MTNDIPLLEEELGTSIPVIRLWNNLLVPLQGDLTDAQASTLHEDVLRHIERRNCTALILDASGLWLVDTHLCSIIADLAKAAALMGTRTILAGIRPQVTLTLLAMDLNLEGIETVLNLEQALELLGIRPPQASRSPGQVALSEMLADDDGDPPGPQEVTT